MGEFQTSIQDPGAILRGSGKVEVAAVAAVPTWVDVGAVSGLSWKEELEVNAEENDNVESEDRVTKQIVTVAFKQLEAIRDAVLTLLRGSLDTRTVVAGTPVIGATQILASGNWDVNKFYPLAYKNASGARPSITTVVGSVDGSLAENADYDIVQDLNGIWGIVLQDLATAPALATIVQNLTITMDYTPIASVKRASGDQSTLSKFMVRITTKNDGKPFYWIGFYGNIKSGFSFEHKKDSDNDRRIENPMELTFKTLPAGQGASANEGLVWEWEQTDGF